jgi:predicted TIM-barrel fold metal-dependent hydrolase
LRSLSGGLEAPECLPRVPAHRPRYFAAAGAGWEPLLRFGQTTIQDNVIYGSGAFLINRPYQQLCDEMRALSLESTTLQSWLWRNAARLLNLERDQAR